MFEHGGRLVPEMAGETRPSGVGAQASPALRARGRWTFVRARAAFSDAAHQLTILRVMARELAYCERCDAGAPATHGSPLAPPGAEAHAAISAAVALAEGAADARSDAEIWP